MLSLIKQCSDTVLCPVRCIAMTCLSVLFFPYWILWTSLLWKKKKKSAQSNKSDCRFLAPAQNCLLGCGGDFHFVRWKQSFPALHYSKTFSLVLLASVSLNLLVCRRRGRGGKREAGHSSVSAVLPERELTVYYEWAWRHVIWLQPLSFLLWVQLRCQENPGSRGFGLASLSETHGGDASLVVQRL